MKADDSAQNTSLPNDTLAFPLSLPAASVGPEVEGPTRFARALKRARFARGWTQTKLAEHLSITKRSIVSWETGDRIPGIGMIVLLLDALFPDEEVSLHHELLRAYIVDDLEREGRRQNAKHPQDDPLLRRVLRVIGHILLFPQRAMMAESSRSISEEQGASQWEEHEVLPQQLQAGQQQALEPLFTLMIQLQQHPELIAVARDFIRELAPDG